MSDSTRHLDALVLGAGVSGLAAGASLRSRNVAIEVWESSQQPGGSVRTVREDGYTADTGPNTFLLRDPEVADFLETSGLQDRMVPAGASGRKRFIYRKGRLRELPTSLRTAACSPFISPLGKLRALLEPLLARRGPGEEDTVADFAARHFGREARDYLFDPFVSGIYAGDAGRLSVSAAFPNLAEWEAKGRSVIIGALRGRRKKEAPPRSTPGLISFDGGMQTLTDHLAGILGQDLRCGVRVEAVERDGEGWRIRAVCEGNPVEVVAANLVLATGIGGLQRLPLPREVTEALAPACDGFPVAGVVSLALGYRREQVDHPLDGFGFLVPSVERQPFLGCLFPSSLFPKRAREERVLLHVFAGGWRHPEALSWNEGTTIKTLLPALSPILGIRGEPEWFRRTLWPEAIPQFNTDYPARRRTMEAVEKRFPGLHLCGNYRHGISLPQSIRGGMTVAEAIAGRRPEVGLSGSGGSEISAPEVGGR